MAYIEIDKNLVFQKLQESLAEEDRPKVPQEAASEQIAADIAKSLEEAEKTKLNQPEAGIRFIFKHTHIQLREGVWEFIVLSVHFLVEFHNPVAVGIGLAEAVRKAVSITTRLDQFDLYLCNAILRVVNRHLASPDILKIIEADRTEIERELTNTGVPIPSNLEERLHHLREEGVLAEVFHGKRGPFYRVVF
jgi:hypothetical protein